MKRFFLGTLLSSLICAGALAQSGQSPAIKQSTSTTDTRQANPPRPKFKKTGSSETDTLTPKKRKQKRVAPDSLRRGGATRVDTVR